MEKNPNPNPAEKMDTTDTAPPSPKSPHQYNINDDLHTDLTRPNGASDSEIDETSSVASSSETDTSDNELKVRYSAHQKSHM